MPSDQSASAFSGAILLGFLQPSARPLLVTLAGAVSLSRVYIGVHYPSDVAVGAIYGLGAGVAVAKVLL
jgi:undecaprenyl-diphosphatase